MVKLAECNYASKEKKIVLLSLITTISEKNTQIVLLQSKTKVTAHQTMLFKVLVLLLIDSASNLVKDQILTLNPILLAIANKETKNVVKVEF
jgi:hypothetical protein